jgi:catalase
MAAPDDRVSTRLVDGLNKLFGVHRGHRAAHAKGLCCVGVFKASAEAASLTRAAHMAGADVPVTVRFSNGAGNPQLPDGAPDGRGVAVRFHLADNRHTDLLAITAPIFPARVPEDFIELMAALTADPRTHLPDLKKIEAFKKAHPELQAALALALGAPALASYARAVYYAVHAFRFTNAVGQARFVRYTWQPQAGTATITPEEAKRRPPDYLQTELRERLSAGPVVFTLHVQLAGDDDDVNDPATTWPESRSLVLVGTLRLSALVSDLRAGCEELVFDPTAVTDGIACSDDRILNARPGTFSVSYQRRTTPSRS